MVGAEKNNNKKTGLVKMLAGSSLSVASTVFYEFILPISMISTTVGLVSNLSGILIQAASKKESKLNKPSSRLRAIGASMMGAGIVGITSPIAGVMYALEGGYSFYTGKKSNIINNVNNFVFQVAAGTKDQEQKYFSKNDLDGFKSTKDLSSQVGDIDTNLKKTSPIPEHITEAALKAGKSARASGVALTSEAVEFPNVLNTNSKGRKNSR
jgi:hypothetical protein